MIARGDRRAQICLGLLALAMAVCVAWVMYEGRRIGIHGDEVIYIDNLVDLNGVPVHRFGLEYFFAPHNSHLVALGKFIFAAIWTVFGTHWWILRAAEVLGILACVGLFYRLATRVTTPILALAFAISLLFLGFAQEVFLWAFDLHTIYSLALGLGALVALERDDRKGDIAACVMFVLAVSLIEVGICFAVGAAVAILMRDDRWKRFWIVVIPGIYYIVWWVWSQHFGQSELKLSNWHLIPHTFARGAAAVAGSIFGLNPTNVGSEFTSVVTAGYVIAAVAFLLLLWRIRRGGLSPTFWVALVTLAGYWLELAFGGREPDASRYIYVPALLCLLVAAEALRGVRVRWWALVIAFILVGLALPPNLTKLEQGANFVRGGTDISGTEYRMMELLGPETPENFTPSLEEKVLAVGGVDSYQLSLGEYREVLSHYGSLGMPLHEIEKAAEPIPIIADATLVTGFDLKLEKAKPPASEKGCTEVSESMIAGTAFFELPKGGAYLRSNAAATMEVKLSRFSRGLNGIPVGTLAPGEWAKLAIPQDSVKLPWDAIVTGPVEICPLR